MIEATPSPRLTVLASVFLLVHWFVDKVSLGADHWFQANTNHLARDTHLPKKRKVKLNHLYLIHVIFLHLYKIISYIK